MSIKSLFAVIAFVLAGAALAPPAFAASSALVLATGVVAAGSTGLATVSHPLKGVYCVLPKSTTLQAKQAAGKLFPQLTFAKLTSLYGTVTITPINIGPNTGTGGLCPSASYIEIWTMSSDGTSPSFTLFVDVAFTIAF